MLAPIGPFKTPYKALKAEAKVNPRLTCYCCGQTFCKRQGRAPSVDHLVPVSHRPLGRTVANEHTLLALLCQPCNLAKSNKPFFEFVAENPQTVQGLRQQAKVLATIPWLAPIGKELVELAQRAARVAARG